MEQFSNADDQQVSLCELSWLGGIVDGEGCITMDKKGGKKRKQQCVSPLISIVNTEEILIAKVISILEKYRIPFYYRVHPPKGNWKKKLEIIIAGQKRVVKFLNLILPYLVSKYYKATLVLNFCESRRNQKGAYSEYDKEICRKIWLLNGRGTKHW